MHRKGAGADCVGVLARLTLKLHHYIVAPVLLLGIAFPTRLFVRQAFLPIDVWAASGWI